MSKALRSGEPVPADRVPIAAPVLAYPSRQVLLEEGMEAPFLRFPTDQGNAGMVAALTANPPPTGCELDDECDDCNPCTIDSCNDVGECVTTNRPLCDLCDDGVFCNGNEKCDDAGNCIPATGVKEFLCNGGPNDALTCPKGDSDCHICVGGDRAGEKCCPGGGICTAGSCVGGDRDTLECCPGGGTCDTTGVCKLQVPNPDPCRFFPTRICDEEEPTSGVGITGACVEFCLEDADCDDGLACNGGEICVFDSNTRGPGHGGECVGGSAPKTVCKTDAECPGFDCTTCGGTCDRTTLTCTGGTCTGEPCAYCGGVCRPDPNNPPPCGEGAVCDEGPPVVCGNGRCCSADPANKTERICCREDRPTCLAQGCPGGQAPHTFLGVGDLPETLQDDAGPDCNQRSLSPPFGIAGESWRCPKYESGITSGNIVDVFGRTGTAVCHPYWEIGDDYTLSNCGVGGKDQWYKVYTIRWIGGHVRDTGSRMRFTFYDSNGRFIEDVITEPAFPGGIELRTVVFSEDPVIPCSGYITVKPAVEFSPDNQAEWTTTDACPGGVCGTGTNDPANVVIRRHGVCVSGEGCNEDADCSVGPCTIDDPETKGGAPLEVVSAASLGLTSGVLAFEIVGEKTTPPLGACCDSQTGKCTEELPWVCEEQGNVFQGIGSACQVCSNDPFQACDAASDCQACQGGDRDGELCCPDNGQCIAGTCVGGTRDGLECCPNGACDTAPVCLPTPPFCQNTACCSKEAGVCQEVNANNCQGGTNPGAPCNDDADCLGGGVCVRASGTCSAGSDNAGAKCITDNECINGECLAPCDALSGYCADMVVQNGQVTAGTTCSTDAECTGIGDGICRLNWNAQGFGTTCEPNCCVQPLLQVGYDGADSCAEAPVVVINVPPIGQPPVTYTFTGNNVNAKLTDFADGTCDSGIFDPEGAFRDRGWWHAFSIDDCADVRLDLCCTSVISGEVHQPQWAVLFEDCNPCTSTVGNSVVGPGSYPDKPIGTKEAANDRGAPFCIHGDDLWQTFKNLPKGTYYHPIYTAPGGHFGDYQFHITVGACQEAACCLPEATCVHLGGCPGGTCDLNTGKCVGGTRDGLDCTATHGVACTDNGACEAGDKRNKVCVNPETGVVSGLCCPGGGACDNDPQNPVCVGGDRDGLPCCTGANEECKGNCVQDCAVLREEDCDALDGFWHGFGNIPVDQGPILTCSEGVCQSTGACCLGPGQCEQHSNPQCDPDVGWPDDVNCCDPATGANCITKKDCDALGGDFVGEALCNYPKQPCPACAIFGSGNCQWFNDGDFLMLMSDLTVPGGGVVHADDFVPDSTVIDTVCVVGTYLDPNQPPGYGCNGDVEDNFRVRFYSNRKGGPNDADMPGDLLEERWATIEGIPTQIPHDGWDAVYDTADRALIYTLKLNPPVVLPTAGETYWIEVANKTDVLAGGTEPTRNSCFWHWAQVMFGATESNRVNAVGSDDRCLGGSRERRTCASGCPGGTCDLNTQTCSGGANDGQPCCPGGTCKAGYGGGYIDGSERWSGTAFCLGNAGAPVNFTPGPIVTGSCCDCTGTCTDGLSMADCADLSAGSDRRWIANRTCPDACTIEPGDDCGAAVAVGGVATGIDCTPPQPVPGACVEVTDGMYAIDTACTNTDGVNVPQPGAGSLGEDVWYCYTTTCTGELVMSMCATGIYFEAMDSYQVVHHDFNNPSDCPCPGETTQFTVAASDEGCNGIADGGAGHFDGQIVFPGECWLLRAGGWGDSAGSTDHGRGMVTFECKPAACFPSSTPVIAKLFGDTANQDDIKNRFISIKAGDPGHQQAIRVRPVSLPGKFTIWEGQDFFVGTPFQVCENSGQPGGPPCGAAPGQPQGWFWAAPLVCDKQLAEFRDWTTLSNYCNGGDNDGGPCTDAADCPNGSCGVDGVVHLYHEAVVPSHLASTTGPIDDPATYEVAVVDSTCPLQVESSYSLPLTVTNAGYGDLLDTVATCAAGASNEEVNVGDLIGELNKFQNLPCAPKKARAELLDPTSCKAAVDFVIGVGELVQVVNAFGSVDAYPCHAGQCVGGACNGGPDDGSPCTNDIDCSTDPCTLGLARKLVEK